MKTIEPLTVSIDEYQGICEALRTQFKTLEAVKKAASCYKVVDGEGNPVEVELQPWAEEVDEKEEEQEEMEKKVVVALSKVAPKSKVASKSAKISAMSNQPEVIAVSAKTKFFKNQKSALIFGHSLAAVFGGNQKSASWLADNGYRTKAEVQLESVNTQGGYLVQPEVAPEIVDLILEFGSFTRWANHKVMSSDTMLVNKLNSIPTVYAIDENTSIDVSKITWKQYALTAKKWGTVCRITMELNDDALINMADEVASEISKAIAFHQDICGWLGSGGAVTTLDSTDYYTGGITGVITKLLSTWTTANTYASLVTDHPGIVGANTTGGWLGVAIGDFASMIGNVPVLARQVGDLAWYTSQNFYGSVMQKLQAQAGGNTFVSVQDGAVQQMFMGYPVRVVNVFPTSSSTNQIPCVFGSLGAAATVGYRKELEILASNQAGDSFLTATTLFRGICRYDVNCHFLGDPNAVRPFPKAGGLIGLMTQAS